MTRGGASPEGIGRLVGRARRLFDEATRAWTSGSPVAGWQGAFAAGDVDVFERDGEVVVAVDLPGATPESVDVQLTRRTLTVSAEREVSPGAQASPDAEASSGAEASPDVAPRHHRRRERSRGPVRRSIELPAAVDPDGASARLSAGVLTVTVPLADRSGDRSVTVE